MSGGMKNVTPENNMLMKSSEDRKYYPSFTVAIKDIPEAKKWEDVIQILTDFKFLEHKSSEVGVLERKDDQGNLVKTYPGVLHLQDDFERVLEVIPGDEKPGSGRRPPLIVTAVESGDGYFIYCPVCNETSPIKKGSLNKGIDCPAEGCSTRLKINPFIIEDS